MARTVYEVVWDGARCGPTNTKGELLHERRSPPWIFARETLGDDRHGSLISKSQRDRERDRRTRTARYNALRIAVRQRRALLKESNA